MKKFILFIVLISMLSCKDNGESIFQPPEYLEQRSEWYNIRKAGPKRYDLIQKQKVIVQRELKTADGANRDAGINGWTEVGPHNIGGRIRDIATGSDPNIIWAGSAGGGILKGELNPSSNDVTWTLVNDFFQSMAISAIAVDTSGSNDVIYAGTGEFFACRPNRCNTGLPGKGLIISFDSGSTWVESSLPNNEIWISEITVDHINPGTAYVLANNSSENGGFTGELGVIYKTFDFGVTWNSTGYYLCPPASPSLIENQVGRGNQAMLDTCSFSYVCDLKINPNNSSELLLTTWGGDFTTQNFKIFKSIDGGISFDSIIFGTGGRCEIEYYNNNPDSVYALLSKNNGNRFELLLSLNSGDSFTSQANDLEWGGVSGSSSQANYNNTMWVHPNKAGELYAGGVDLYKSVDSGDSFTKISDWKDFHNGDDIDNDSNVANSIHADQHSIIAFSDFSSNNERVWFSNDGGVAHTNDISSLETNSGYHLHSDINLSVTQLVGASEYNGSYIGGAHDNSFSFGGSNGMWSQWTTGDGGYCAMDPYNSNRMYSTTQLGRVWGTTDGGTTWSTLANFSSQGASFYAPLEIDSNDPTIYLGAQNLHWSQDQGNTWEIKSDYHSSFGPIWSIGLAESDTNTVYLGYQSGIIRKSIDFRNMFNSWTRIDNNGDLPQDTAAISISVHPQNANLLAVSYAGYHQRNIWISSNGGNSWSNKSLDFDMQVNVVLWHPTNQNLLYAGTDIGIFASNDSGTNWSVSPLYSKMNNDGPVFTEVSDMCWKNTNLGTETKLVAATHGRGLWVSNEIRDSIFIDKDTTLPETGTRNFPYKTLTLALDDAGHGTVMVFLSSGVHDEISSPLIVDKGVKIVFENGNNPVIIE